MKSKLPYYSGAVVSVGYVLLKSTSEKTPISECLYYYPNTDNLSSVKLLAKCKNRLRRLKIKSGSKHGAIIAGQQFNPMLTQAIIDFLEKKDDSMYYCEVYKNFEGFETAAIRNRVAKIVLAAKHKKRCRVRYVKTVRCTAHSVVRDVAAYSYTNGMLFVSDTKHGTSKIRSYKVRYKNY